MNPFRASGNPHLLEVAARSWVRRVRPPGGAPGLDGIPDAVLEEIRQGGYHGVWLMGSWTTGPAGRRLAQTHPDLRTEYDRILPGWTEADVGGSPYSVQAYEPGPELGGWDALARFRARLHTRGLGLMLDFVPNHLACDHPWTRTHPERLVTGTEDDLAAAPESWFRAEGPGGEPIVFAHGRDPNFAGWTDTVQVDYRRRETHAAMTDLLRDVASRCDALRCDVAMLVLPDVFERTWGALPGEAPGDFWTDSITALRGQGSDVLLLAEAYWDRERDLIRAGFDYAYDKGLTDALLDADVDAVRARLSAPGETLRRGAHFLENHDEERAIVSFGPDRMRAAAAVAYGIPGLRFFHDGQAEGRRVRAPVQLSRVPEEPVDEECRTFYARLRTILRDPIFHRGTWTAPEVRPAGPDDPLPPIVAGAWRLGPGLRVVVANLSDATARARIPLPIEAGGPAQLRLLDELDGRDFERDRKELLEPGLFVELGPWGVHFLREDGTPV